MNKPSKKPVEGKTQVIQSRGPLIPPGLTRKAGAAALAIAGFSATMASVGKANGEEWMPGTAVAIPGLSSTGVKYTTQALKNGQGSIDVVVIDDGYVKRSTTMDMETFSQAVDIPGVGQVGLDWDFKVCKNGTEAIKASGDDGISMRLYKASFDSTDFSVTSGWTLVEGAGAFSGGVNNIWCDNAGNMAVTADWQSLPNYGVWYKKAGQQTWSHKSLCSYSWTDAYGIHIDGNRLFVTQQLPANPPNAMGGIDILVVPWNEDTADCVGEIQNAKTLGVENTSADQTVMYVDADEDLWFSENVGPNSILKYAKKNSQGGGGAGGAGGAGGSGAEGGGGMGGVGGTGGSGAEGGGGNMGGMGGGGNMEGGGGEGGTTTTSSSSSSSTETQTSTPSETTSPTTDTEKYCTPVKGTFVPSENFRATECQEDGSFIGEALGPFMYQVDNKTVPVTKAYLLVGTEFTYDAQAGTFYLGDGVACTPMEYHNEQFPIEEYPPFSFVQHGTYTGTSGTFIVIDIPDDLRLNPRLAHGKVDTVLRVSLEGEQKLYAEGSCDPSEETNQIECSNPLPVNLTLAGDANVIAGTPLNPDHRYFRLDENNNFTFPGVKNPDNLPSILVINESKPGCSFTTPQEGTEQYAALVAAALGITLLRRRKGK